MAHRSENTPAEATAQHDPHASWLGGAVIYDPRLAGLRPQFLLVATLSPSPQLKYSGSPPAGAENFSFLAGSGAIIAGLQFMGGK